MRTALLDPVVWFWVPLGLGVLGVLPIITLRSRSSVSLAGAASLAFVAISCLATAGWSWCLRDGLGPGCVPSTGAAAWVRFWAQFWLPLVICAVAVVTVLALWRRRLVALRAHSGSR